MIKPLTDNQHIRTRQQAARNVIALAGRRPRRAQFQDHTPAAYPPAFTRAILALCLIVLAAAFTPSALRLYHLGSRVFGQAINHNTSQIAVGAATIATAELGAVLFSLALATLGTSRISKLLLLSAIGLTTAIALIGNVELALWGKHITAFACLEAIAPPLLVLADAFVLKEQALAEIKRRYANERAFREADAAWLSATQDPGKHPKFEQFWANALQAKFKARKNCPDLTKAQWRQLIFREMNADDWYTEPATGEEDTQPFDPFRAERITSNNGGQDTPALASR